MDLSDVVITGLAEGTLVSAKTPLLTIEGPISKVQLLETPLLNLVGFATLVATKAMRIRQVAGPTKSLLEFGARRAHSPQSAVIASYAAIIGGFDGTSNVKAAEMHNIHCKGTMAHAYISSHISVMYKGIVESEYMVVPKNTPSTKESLAKYVITKRKELGGLFLTTNDSELGAFMSYACIHPNNFLPIVDTFGTLKSGIYNFILVASSLQKLGYSPVGVRLDSGDLAYISIKVREICNKYLISPITIVASNDIDEDVIKSLNEQNHEIDAFGVGTKLVNPKQSLGCVYKMVEFDGLPTTKLSDTKNKISIPGKKCPYRLYICVDNKIFPYVDVLVPCYEEKDISTNCTIMCRHPFDDSKRFNITPYKIIKLHQVIWDNNIIKDPTMIKVDMMKAKKYVKSQVENFRVDHLRFVNPTPYKVSLTNSLKHKFDELVETLSPVITIS